MRKRKDRDSQDILQPHWGSVPWDAAPGPGEPPWGQWGKELELYLRMVFLIGRQPSDTGGPAGILFTGAFGVVEADVLGVWVPFTIDRSECLQWGGMWGRGHLGTARGWVAYKYLPTEALNGLACGLAEGLLKEWHEAFENFCSSLKYTRLYRFLTLHPSSRHDHLNILENHNGWKVYCLVAIKIKKCISVSKLQSTVVQLPEASPLAACSAQRGTCCVNIQLTSAGTKYLFKCFYWLGRDLSMCLNAF